MLVPAVLLSAPWFIRNGLTYGWRDPTGLARHDVVVEGQPRSSEWLALYGWGGLLGRMARTTFQSFWGQFGWMAVPLPPRIYHALALLSTLLIAGFIAWLIRQHHPSQFTNLPTHQSPSLATFFTRSFRLFYFLLLCVVQSNLRPAPGPLPLPGPHSHRDGGCVGIRYPCGNPATASASLGDDCPFRRAGGAGRILSV